MEDVSCTNGTQIINLIRASYVADFTLFIPATVTLINTGIGMA